MKSDEYGPNPPSYWADERIEELEDKLAKAEQELRDATPSGSRNLRASLNTTAIALARAEQDIEKFKGILQENGVAITKRTDEIVSLRNELAKVNKRYDNALARIEDLVHDVEVLEKENQSLRAAVGINEPIIPRRNRL
jgi:chromosome segregation ATPase